MFIQNKDAQLYTVEFGTGPHTILAHGGWTGSWELWTEPFTYLSKSWRTIAYDHRGTGATISPVESITLENLVDDLFIVMDKMEVEKCVLAAESAGGIVAVSAALQQPQRFDGLVLVDALLHSEDNRGNAAFIQGLKTNFEQTVERFVDSCVLESENNSKAIRSWGRKILGRSTPEASIQLLESTFGVDLRPRLSEITTPTLVIHGDRDDLVPLSDAEFAASQISNSHLHVVKGAGHVPTVTSPREVAYEINQFFSK